MILLTISLPFLLVLVNFKQKKTIQDAKNCSFYISEDICIRKYIETDHYDPPTDSHYLQFSNYGKFYCEFCFLNMVIGSQAHKSVCNIYEKVDVGEKVYILRFWNCKDVWIFPKCEWQLNTTEFACDDNMWFPIKNA